MTDRNNKQERVWDDPVIPKQRASPEDITLGAGVPNDVRQAFIELGEFGRMARVITTVTLGLVFTVSYAMLKVQPNMTPDGILSFFIGVTVATTLAEIARYYRIF